MLLTGFSNRGIKLCGAPLTTCVHRRPIRRCSTLAGGELLQCVQREGGIAHLAPGGTGGSHGAAASAPEASASGEAIPPLEVVYEDEHMACVVKPPGVPVDSPPGRSSQAGAAVAQGADADGGTPAGGPRTPPLAAPSVYTRLPRSLAPSRQLGALRRPRHCHRLDEPTGGLLLVGKTRQAQAALCGAFQDRRVSGPGALPWWCVAERGTARRCVRDERGVLNEGLLLPGRVPCRRRTRRIVAGHLHALACTLLGRTTLGRACRAAPPPSHPTPVHRPESR